MSFTSDSRVTPELGGAGESSLYRPDQGCHPEGPKPGGIGQQELWRVNKDKCEVLRLGRTVWRTALCIRGCGGHQAGHEPAIGRGS